MCRQSSVVGISMVQILIRGKSNLPQFFVFFFFQDFQTKSGIELSVQIASLPFPIYYSLTTLPFDDIYPLFLTEKLNKEQWPTQEFCSRGGGVSTNLVEDRG